MGGLSYGELAGEHMQFGLLLHDPEEEHDCFSDNTHHSRYYSALGIRNVYLGEYRRVDGSMINGPGISALVAVASPATDARLRSQLQATLAAMGRLVSSAEGGEAYDQMIGAGNAAGNARVPAAIEDLRLQTEGIGAAAEALRLAAVEFDGLDSALTTRKPSFSRCGTPVPLSALRRRATDENGTGLTQSVSLDMNLVLPYHSPLTSNSGQTS